jgi:hypothetical protein
MSTFLNTGSKGLRKTDVRKRGEGGSMHLRTNADKGKGVTSYTDVRTTTGGVIMY